MSLLAPFVGAKPLGLTAWINRRHAALDPSVPASLVRLLA